MSAVGTMSIQEIRTRYLQSLSPIERMDYELACAREKRLVAEREHEARETERLLRRVDENEGAGAEPDFRLSWREFRLLKAELRRLKGGAA